MKNVVRQRALQLGFDDCRFTTAAPPQSGAQFQNWLAAKEHGEMSYLQRNAGQRIDPQKVMEGANSIILLTASYEVESSTPEVPSGFHKAPGIASNGRFSGAVARYARFTDYHKVMGERLKVLSAFVDQIGGKGTRSLWYIDTGPFLERDLAQRAGLGFIGKHTNLISRQSGNWLFIAEIITTLEFETDTPENNRCGSCTRCLTACPTQAITAPFRLDARRCISYLTIELKGPIPVSLRVAMGNRIYGCDDCLAVCPWNRFARQGKLMREHSRPDLAQPDLLGLLALDELGFKARFAGTPILRIKRRGLFRNVCVALGNVGDSSALPALARAAGELDPLITEHATWAIGQIQGRRATGKE